MSEMYKVFRHYNENRSPYKAAKVLARGNGEVSSHMTNEDVGKLLTDLARMNLLHDYHNSYNELRRVKWKG